MVFFPSRFHMRYMYVTCVPIRHNIFLTHKDTALLLQNLHIQMLLLFCSDCHTRSTTYSIHTYVPRQTFTYLKYVMHICMEKCQNVLIHLQCELKANCEQFNVNLSFNAFGNHKFYESRPFLSISKCIINILRERIYI